MSPRGSWKQHEPNWEEDWLLCSMTWSQDGYRGALFQVWLQQGWFLGQKGGVKLWHGFQESSLDIRESFVCLFVCLLWLNVACKRVFCLQCKVRSVELLAEDFVMLYLIILRYYMFCQRASRISIPLLAHRRLPSLQRRTARELLSFDQNSSASPGAAIPDKFQIIGKQMRRSRHS